MKTAKFNPDGGPIVVEITPLKLLAGSYTILLWEADTNKVVAEWKGNFINTDDDAYALPTPNSKNDGRILETFVTFTLLPPHKGYGVEMTASQDGQELAREQQSGSSDNLTVTVSLLIKLEAS